MRINHIKYSYCISVFVYDNYAGEIYLILLLHFLIFFLQDIIFLSVVIRFIF